MLTNYPNGLSSFGQIVQGGPTQYLGAQGKLFMVCSSAAKYAYTRNLVGSYENGVEIVYLQDATHNGIQGAIDACRAGYGDVIQLEPGYYTVATKINWNKSRVTMYARQDGQVNTVLYGSGLTGSNVMGVTKGYFKFVGITFHVDSGATGAGTTADVLCDDAAGGGDNGGFGQFINCGFSPEGNGVGSSTYGVDIKGANNIDFINCYFVGLKTAGINVRGGVGNPINIRISNCKFIGTVTGVDINGVTYGMVIEDSMFFNATYPASMAMTNGVDTTGVAAGEIIVKRCVGDIATFEAGAGGISVLDAGAQGYVRIT